MTESKNPHRHTSKHYKRAHTNQKKVRASYLEVYEDRIYDLLDVSNRDKPMEEWETVTPLADGEGNQVLKGLTTFDVDNEGEETSKGTMARYCPAQGCFGDFLFLVSRVRVGFTLGGAKGLKCLTYTFFACIRLNKCSGKGLNA